MKASFIVLLFLLGSMVAQAQGSCFSHGAAVVSSPMNIRQSHNIGSPVIRTVAAGESLPVSSSTRSGGYCWLQVAGGWMAQTRRVQPGQPASVPNVDNCCFVDRQCNTDQEWTDGYWDFQNKQCAVPAQTTSTSSQPSNIDNCCFVDRQCTTDDEWARGYQAYQNYECRQLSPGEASAIAPYPPIEGTPDFVTRIRTGLDWLRERSSKWYLYVAQPTRHIKVSAGDLFGSAISFAYGRSARLEIHPEHLDPPSNLASWLVHEACHLHQWNRGWRVKVWDFDGKKAKEDECYGKQVEMLNELAPGHSLLWQIPRLLEWGLYYLY